MSMIFSSQSMWTFAEGSRSNAETSIEMTTEVVDDNIGANADIVGADTDIVGASYASPRVDELSEPEDDTRMNELSEPTSVGADADATNTDATEDADVVNTTDAQIDKEEKTDDDNIDTATLSELNDEESSEIATTSEATVEAATLSPDNSTGELRESEELDVDLATISELKLATASELMIDDGLFGNIDSDPKFYVMYADATFGSVAKGSVQVEVNPTDENFNNRSCNRLFMDIFASRNAPCRIL